jgi:hypothetical protein
MREPARVPVLIAMFLPCHLGSIKANPAMLLLVPGLAAEPGKPHVAAG